MPGKYFSKTFTSTLAGDLIDQLKTALTLDNILIKKLTLITDTETHVDVNNLGVYSELYLGTDGLYKLSLDSNDVLINSLITQEANSPIFLACIF